MENTRFKRNDNLAPFFDSSKNDSKAVPRSSFDLSRSHSFQLNFGMLSVADCIETVPNGTYQLNTILNAQFRVPTNRKLINNCRLFVEYYYCKESDLWEGAQNTITKGRSGNINKEYPQLVFNFKRPSDFETVRYDTPDSLMDDFGLPCSYAHDPNKEGYKQTKSYQPIEFNSQSSNDIKLLEDNDNLFINALPFVMYQKVCRDFYLPKNLIQNNKHILPDNEQHFILPYDATKVGYLSYISDVESQTTISPSGYVDLHDVSFANANTRVILAQKRFRQLRGDTFTTAFPFPDGIRGDIPTLDLTTDISDLAVTVPSYDFLVPSLSVRNSQGSTKDLVWTSEEGVHFSNTAGIVENTPIVTTSHRVTVPEQDATVNLVDFKTSITMNDIRTLEAFTVFQERMAQTDGDYSDMIKAQFGYSNVKSSRKPVYIGGYYQDILVNSIYQTSESSGNSPLGRQSGIGVSSGRNNIGSFTAPDYGYIMAIVSCVPELYYNTGIERMFSRRVQSDKYFPIMNDLPPQAILNKELFVKGDSAIDEDIFAYQERFSEYKSRRNILTGKGRFYTELNVNEGDDSVQPIDIYDNARAIQKPIIRTPNLNANFVTADNVDLSVFSVTDEMPIDIDFGSQVRAILPMPYVSTPGGDDDNY